MNAYIVAGYRTAVGKAPRGVFRFTRPDDLGADVVKHLLASLPSFDPMRIDDVIVGNAIPEAEQGLNFARYISLMGIPQKQVPAMTINRYCASGLEAIALASAKIHAGYADAIVAGGAEHMSIIPMGGWRIAPNADLAKAHPDYYLGMGNTAEAVAEQFGISREDSDQFSYTSHMRAIAAIESGKFKDEIVPITVKENYLDENMKKKTREYIVDTDEGPRKDTTVERLAKLKPAFHAKGVVTAGNSSQTSDGAAFVLVVSEKVLKEHNLTPIARLVGYNVAGVEPRIMGIGPVEAIPAALKNAGLSLNDISVIELNEAFATQSLAVVRQLGLNPEIVNPNGGAIAMGHPLGCTGAKLSVQLFNELRRVNGKYGIVSACVGGGQGIAGIYERLN
jgi:acetyl-CoA acyltransferase